jgi:secreted Zn-dependent insulinase-like peptidase
LDISVSGYNDKMSALLEKVLNTMRGLVINQDRFIHLANLVPTRYKAWF